MNDETQNELPRLPVIPMTPKERMVKSALFAAVIITYLIVKNRRCPHTDER